MGDFSEESNEGAVSMGWGTPFLGWIMSDHMVFLLSSQFSHVEANWSCVCSHPHAYVYMIHVCTYIYLYMLFELSRQALLLVFTP